MELIAGLIVDYIRWLGNSGFVQKLRNNTVIDYISTNFLDIWLCCELRVNLKWNWIRPLIDWSLQDAFVLSVFLQKFHTKQANKAQQKQEVTQIGSKSKEQSRT